MINENKVIASVIMPCLNAANTISEAINSVLSQDFKNFELIIIDDGSRDNSVEIIKSYVLLDSRVKLIINPNPKKGVGFARNIGISMASGRYIAFLDADDYLLEHSLSRRVNTAIINNYKIVYGPYLRLLPDGSIREVYAKPKITFNEILLKNYIGNLTGLYDSSYFGKVQQDDIPHEDYLMWASLIKISGAAYSTGKSPLGVYRVSPGSLSANKLKAFFWHWTVLRRGLKINLFYSFYLQLFYFVLSIKPRIAEIFK
jgi:glycosyltransferase involved in cell wall biosynthesis